MICFCKEYVFLLSLKNKNQAINVLEDFNIWEAFPPFRTDNVKIQRKYIFIYLQDYIDQYNKFLEVELLYQQRVNTFKCSRYCQTVENFMEQDRSLCIKI